MNKTISFKLDIGWPTILTAIFITLKLTGTIGWSWFWVLSPLWIWVLWVIFIFIILAIALEKKGKL